MQPFYTSPFNCTFPKHSLVAMPCIWAPTFRIYTYWETIISVCLLDNAKTTRKCVVNII